MDALAVLQLIAPQPLARSAEDSEQHLASSAEDDVRPLARSAEDSEQLSASSAEDDVLPLARPLRRADRSINSALELLTLLPRGRHTIHQGRHNGKVGKKQRATRLGIMQQTAKVRTFNSSGLAVTADDLMCDPASSAVKKVVKVKGKGAWRKWLPEPIQRAAFSKGTHRDIAHSMRQTHGKRVGSDKRAHGMIAKCKMSAAQIIVTGQDEGLKRKRRESQEQPFAFWITNHVFDETKLWYSVRGQGFRKFSTLAHHSQVTWKDARGIHDEDIIRTPKAMRRYNAAVQWNILNADGILGGPRGYSNEKRSGV